MQARTTSTRLPGKALLPVAGHPSAILAALRARNRGHETMVATSVDPSDDELAEKCSSHGIRVLRGPLHDVLARYFLAVANLPDNCIVVRLTGDNLVPDGGFVGALVASFADSSCEYLAASPLPCGLGGEAFSAGTLRQAHGAARSASDREHVGLWMKRNCKSEIYFPKSAGGADYSHLRCTLDDWEDYQRILRLFDGVEKPVDISYSELMERLASLPGETSYRVSG